jgi:hypothetical protein
MNQQSLRSNYVLDVLSCLMTLNQKDFVDLNDAIRVNVVHKYASVGTKVKV